MGTQKIEVVMNIPDMKIAENLMTKAFNEILSDKINKLPVEQRKGLCDEILEMIKNDCVEDNE